LYFKQIYHLQVTILTANNKNVFFFLQKLSSEENKEKIPVTQLIIHLKTQQENINSDLQNKAHVIPNAASVIRG